MDRSSRASVSLQGGVTAAVSISVWALCLLCRGGWVHLHMQRGGGYSWLPVLLGVWFMLPALGGPSL